MNVSNDPIFGWINDYISDLEEKYTNRKTWLNELSELEKDIEQAKSVRGTQSEAYYLEIQNADDINEHISALLEEQRHILTQLANNG